MSTSTQEFKADRIGQWSDPQEFTVVNIVGPVDIEKLASLQGEFGIPHFTKGEDHE